MNGRFSSSSVDWSRVDRELDGLPSDFRTQRFDSLKHVIEILASVDPKDLVEELAASKSRLESLISNVVDVYHNGFNLALQNYSKILHLFNESREQVDSIQLALQEARRRLGAQNLTLETHWQRSVKLDTICKILEDVESLTAAPSQIDAFQAQRDWPSAVSLLLDACNRLNRKELEKIHALGKIKDDLGTRWKMLISQITNEIEQMILSQEVCRYEGEKEPVPSATPSKLALKRLNSFQMGHTPKHSRFSSILSVGTSSGDREGVGGLNKSSSFGLTKHRPSFKLHESSSYNLEQQQQDWPVETLVDSLSQMGCLSEAKESLRRGLVKNIKSIIAAAMQRVKRNEYRTQDISSFGPQQQNKTNQNLSIPSVVAEASEELLSSVCHRVQRILQNSVSVFKVVALKDAHANSIASLRPAFLQRDEGANSKPLQDENKPSVPASEETKDLKSLTGFEYLDAACLDVWNIVQEELIQIIAEMLNVPMKQLEAHNATDSMARVWLNRLDEKRTSSTNKPTTRSKSIQSTEKKSRLTFSFGVDVETANTSKDLICHSVDKTDASYAKHIKEVLNHPGGAYLAPVVYKRVSEFLATTKREISLALREFETMSGALVMNSAKSINDGGQRIKSFMENFVMETFLPQVWVDFRGRVTASMEDPEAFRPQIRTRSTSRNLDQGEQVLRAGTMAEKMVQEVMSWALAMPPFASSLTGVIENILGRVQEAFSNQVHQILMDTTSGKLALNQELAYFMILESDAEAISDAAQFYIVGPGESVDHSVSPVPFPAGSIENELTEQEIIKAVLNERPILAEQVIARPGNFYKMVQLASLSDTLDFVAQCVSDISIHHPEIACSPSNTTEQLRSSQKGKKTHRKSSANIQYDGLFTSLAMLIDRYRSLSGICIRCMRLEMITLSVHHLSELSEISHLCDEADQKEIPSFIGSFIKNAARVQEEISSHLSQKKMHYILNILPAACTHMLMNVLPDFGQMNQGGVDRIQKIMSFLKPAILSLLGTTSASERLKHFDHASDYYGMLSLHVYDLMNYIRRHPGKFTFREYKAILAIHVPGRRIADVHFNEMESITEKPTEARLKKLQQLNSKRGRSHLKH